VAGFWDLLVPQLDNLLVAGQLSNLPSADTLGLVSQPGSKLHVTTMLLCGTRYGRLLLSDVSDRKASN